jgi:hypothetical protein
LHPIIIRERVEHGLIDTIRMIWLGVAWVEEIVEQDKASWREDVFGAFGRLERFLVSMPVIDENEVGPSI